MTIKEVAKQRGISPQAVYARLKAAGIDAASITDAKTHQITEEGLKQIDNLFEKQSNKTSTIDSQDNRLESLQAEIESLKARLKAAEEQRDEWKAQADAWKEAAQQAQQTAQQAQALNMATLQGIIKALPAAQEKPAHKGIFGFFKRDRKTETEAE